MSKPKPMLNDIAYDTLKKLVQVWLPAFGALYFGMAQIYNLPAAEQVVGTLALITTFFGVTLGVSSKRYLESDAPFNGDLVLEPKANGGMLYSLELSNEFEELEQMDVVALKVVKPPA